MKSLFNPFGVSVEESPLKRVLPALILSIFFGYIARIEGTLINFICIGLLFFALLPCSKDYYKPFGSKFLIAVSVLSYTAFFFQESDFGLFVFLISLIILRISQEFFEKQTKTYNWILRLIAFCFIQPAFEPICFIYKYINRLFAKVNLKFSFFKDFIGYIAIFFVALFFVGLFCVASPQFKVAMDYVVDFIKNVIPDLTEFFELAAMAWFFFGLFSITCYSALIKSNDSLKEKEAEPVAKKERLSAWHIKMFTVALVVFNLIFLLQNIFDINYILSGCKLPKGTTFAEYAMDGAQALAVTTLVAIIIILFCFQETTKTNEMRTARKLAYVWIVQNVMLCISSCIRLLAYTNAYDITTSRFYGFVYFFIIFVGFVLTSIKISKEKPMRWLIDANIYSVIFIFVLLANFDVDRFVANYNVNQFLEKKDKLDFAYLESIYDYSSVIPAMVKLASGEEHQFSDVAKAYLREKREYYNNRNLEGRNFNYRDYQIKKLLNSGVVK